MADRDEDTTMLAKSIGQLRKAAGAERVHYLFISDGPDKGRRIPLGTNPIVIGRSAPADLVLDDQQVSRNHCRVCLAMNEIIVIDLQSSNGTFIDGNRISGGAPLPVGARLQVGSHVIEHEWRNREDVEESLELDRDLEQAWNYIQSLLPTPLADGPIRADWALVPCARLGGDAFGYRYLDTRRFAIYLIDVSGHGTGAAMHAVSVINVLRQPVLPAEDYADPGKVLTAMNNMFRMETHGNLYLTVWYGVYDLETRALTYASAGHHASYVVTTKRDTMTPLKTRNPAIGVMPSPGFNTASEIIPVGSTLYVFSDGVFEITTRAGRDWDLEDFEEVMRRPPAEGVSEPQRLLRTVREVAKSPNLDDDFSMMTFTFTGFPDRSPTETWPNRG